MTYPTEAAIAALAANGHKVTTEIDGVTYELRRGSGGSSRSYFWVPEWKGERWPIRCADPHNAVRCAMLDRIEEAGYGIAVGAGSPILTGFDPEGRDIKHHDNLLAAYKAVCTPATLGEVAAEPVSDADELKGGAMATNEQMYEAMVARGHMPDGWGIAYDKQLATFYFVNVDECPAVPWNIVSACLLAGQLEALYSKAHGKHMHAWVAQTGCDPSRLFEFYLAAFPLPSPPDPSAAEELVAALHKALSRGGLDAIPMVSRAVAQYESKHAATAGGR